MKNPDPKIQRLMNAITDYAADSIDGVTLRSITADLLTGPVQAREALQALGATEINGKWHLPQDDAPASAKLVAAPKSETEIPVSEQKQAIEAPKAIVADVPELVDLASDPAPAPLIKEPKTPPLRTQLIDLLKKHPEGVTKEHAMEQLGVTLFTFKTVLQTVREDFTVLLIPHDGKKVYVMRDDFVSAPAPAPAPAPKEIEMQQPAQVQQQPKPQPVAAQPEPVQQPTNLEGWVFIDSTGTFKTAPRQTAAMAIDAMERLGNRAIDELMRVQGLRLAKVRVVTETLFVMGAVA